MFNILIGAGVYLVILYFAVRFFQTVHGWDEQMAGLIAKKEQFSRHEGTGHRKQKHTYHRTTQARRRTAATAH